MVEPAATTGLGDNAVAKTRLERLAEAYPWPADRPDVPPSPSGWFGAGNKRLLGERITANTKLIMELGSWVGMSTRWLLDHAPQATVLAIDHFKGSADHFLNPDPAVQYLLPVLYETFCVNLWDYRDRLVPMRTTTIDGMIYIYQLGLEPDLVYIDAAHDTESVLTDIETAHRYWPRAALVGDDWSWDTVQAAVKIFAREKRLRIVTDDNAYALETRPLGS